MISSAKSRAAAQSRKPAAAEARRAVALGDRRSRSRSCRRSCRRRAGPPECGRCLPTSAARGDQSPDRLRRRTMIAPAIGVSHAGDERRRAPPGRCRRRRRCRDLAAVQRQARCRRATLPCRAARSRRRRATSCGGPGSAADSASARPRCPTISCGKLAARFVSAVTRSPTSLPARSTSTRSLTAMHLVQLVRDEDDRQAPAPTSCFSVANSASVSAGVSTAVGSSRIRMRASR